MNGETNKRLEFWANRLFFMLPVLAATYIALVLVPAASDRWPARFVSWQELSLVIVIIVFSVASARPLYRLRYDLMGRRPGLNSVAAVISLFALVGGATALYLHSSRWVVGAFLIGAALPPVIRGLAVVEKAEPDRRFNL